MDLNGWADVPALSNGRCRGGRTGASRPDVAARRSVAVGERSGANRLNPHGIRDRKMIEDGAQGLQHHRRELFFVLGREGRNESNVHIDSALEGYGGVTVVQFTFRRSGWLLKRTQPGQPLLSASLV